MTDQMSRPLSRRTLLATSAAAGVGLAMLSQAGAASSTAARGSSEIRPFRIDVSEDDLADLRRRVNATKFAEAETVPVGTASVSSQMFTQGVPLATVQKLAHYWGTEFDWRKSEARLKHVSAVHHGDRRARHSLGPRSVQA